jgi:predicted nucleic acid-binding protein
MIYLDTSAFLRAFLRDAPDYQAAVTLLASPDHGHISSELLWLEADRAGHRIVAEKPELSYLPSQIDIALGLIEKVRLDTSIINAARSIPQVIKSLDAIHVATAELLGSSIDCFVTYDTRMAQVLTERGLKVSTASQFLNLPDA